MPLIIKIAIPVLITAIIIAGGVILWKYVLNPTTKIPVSAAMTTLKANNADDSIIVPFETPIVLSWDSQGVDNCLISGDWYSPVSTSGSQSVGKITKHTNYILVCVDDKGTNISDSVAINIDEKTIPRELLPDIALGELFKDFRYHWQKQFCRELKNDPDVTALQTVLFIEGILTPQDKITGNFDEETFEAVKKFQENYDITPQTGCVGPVTMAKLNELYGYDGLVATQKQISKTTQKLSSYQQQQTATVISPAPTPTSTSTPTSTPTAPTTVYIKTPTVDLKINGSNNIITVALNTIVALSWTSSNAKSCSASSGWTGSKPLSGTESISIAKFSHFVLTCVGENNKFASDSMSVKVPLLVAATSTITTPPPPKIDSIIPPTGWPGMLIKIKGSYFSPDSKINIGGIKLSPQKSDEESLTFIVPGLTRGHYGVRVEDSATGNSNVKTFYID